MKSFFAWLDDRTGIGPLLHESLYENIPGGSRWRYVSGSMLVFAFITQVITGLFLWMAYSPGSQNAWESVYYIQNEMAGGWLLRGVHHFMAQAMVVLLPLHMLQVIVDKAYKAPREINFWFGLVLMLLVLGLSLTGYLLPWDQKGYWATKVATNLMSLAPGGQYLQKVVVGGSDYGHHTLTRFFAMHAGVLPALLVLFLALHVAMFRKHGITAEPSAKRPDQFFWPHQVFKDSIACLILLVIVLVAVVHADIGGVLTGNLPVEHRGAELGAPADAAEEYSAARPEWYFLFLFQLLKKFKSEFFGAIVLPGLVMLFLFAMPLTGKVKYGHIVNVVVFVSLLVGSIYLTSEAMHEDKYATLYTYDAEKHAGDAEAEKRYKEPFEASRKYLAAVEQGEREYERIRELIEFYGIPRDGARALQRDDPETQGPRLFQRNCASCHSYVDDEGNGIAASEVSAPNLYGFATPAWFRRILSADDKSTAEVEGITSHSMFGKTKHASGEMVDFVNGNLKNLVDAKKQALDDLIAALAAEASLISRRDEDAKARADDALQRGKKALSMTFEDSACTDCHKFHDKGDIGAAPDLTGYGSYEWLKAFISDPSDDRFYGDKNDRMPQFAAHPEMPAKNLLSEHDVDMLVRWLRGDDKDLHLKKLALAAAEQESPAATTQATAPPEPQPASAEPASLGARLFKTNCARCHSYLDADGKGFAGPQPKEDGSPNGGPNLYGFASRAWLNGFLDPEKIVTNEYFGNTAHGKKDKNGKYKEGAMVEFVELTLSGLSKADRTALDQIIATLSAEAALPAQREADETAANDGTIESGRDAMINTFGCTDCHTFHKDGDPLGPDLTGYGSVEWLIGMISDPKAKRFYPESNDRMPAFAAHADMPEMNRLSAEELQSLARWIRGEEAIQASDASK
jgi:ubiquinol-cytochrome c reductase cytochrome b subunit